jgi:hypothetical protein
MLAYVRGVFAGVATAVCIVFVTHSMPSQNRPRTMLLEVVRNSWDVERNETLVYLRVYSDGFAEAHPMRKVDFRDIRFATKQLSDDQLEILKHMLFESATMQLQSRYSRYWGYKDYGYKYSVTIYGPSRKKLDLANFQPFLARKEGKPYPSQVERLGCEIWRLRTEVTGEPLEKDWLKGCAALGY